jgi:hypothetical protein
MSKTDEAKVRGIARSARAGMRMAATAGRAVLGSVPKPKVDEADWTIQTNVPLTEDDKAAIDSIVSFAKLRKELKR